jgi:hypothetical protein
MLTLPKRLPTDYPILRKGQNFVQCIKILCDHLPTHGLSNEGTDYVNKITDSYF